MTDDVVLVEYLGEWRPATVLWRYLDGHRPRALVRFETESGLVLRQLRWADELQPTGHLLVLPMSAHVERPAPARHHPRVRPPGPSAVVADRRSADVPDPFDVGSRTGPGT